MNIYFGVVCGVVGLVLLAISVNCFTIWRPESQRRTNQPAAVDAPATAEQPPAIELGDLVEYDWTPEPLPPRTYRRWERMDEAHHLDTVRQSPVFTVVKPDGTRWTRRSVTP